MTVAHHRLARQRLVGEPPPSAEAVVGHLVAVQAQDDAGARWGVAQRTIPTTDAALDAHLVVVDGRLAGGWSRVVKGRAVTVAPTLLRPLTESEWTALTGQAERYAAFLDGRVDVRATVAP